MANKKTKEEIMAAVREVMGEMPTFDSEATKAVAEKAKAVKGKIDEALIERVVEPLARAGHEDLGAAVAAGLSSAAEVAVPEHPMEVVPIGGAMKPVKYVVGKGIKQIDKPVAVVRGPLAEMMHDAKVARETAKAAGLIKAGATETPVFEKVRSIDEAKERIKDEITQVSKADAVNRPAIKEATEKMPEVKKLSIEELEMKLNNLKNETDALKPGGGKVHEWANVKSIINMRAEEAARPKAKAKYTEEEWRERLEDALNKFEEFRRK